MANLSSIARPYALATFNFAKEKGQLVAWTQFLGNAAQIAKNKDVAHLFANPKVSVHKLYTLFETVLGGDALAKENKNFLKLLAEHKRFNVLPEIYDEFNRLYAELEKMSRVKVVTAIDLQDEYKQKLIKTLSKRIQREVTLECNVDPAILGGAIIYIGEDQVIDGSIRGKINRLGESLIGESLR